jgi:3-(3-hydroxy-phenyl)propionate hydroxylase
MQRFRHGRVLFAGDAAHVVSPFGARGANSGIQDADNLVWKLELVLKGLAADRLLDSYDAERTRAADENILNSTRSTDFITPKSNVSRTFRDATLGLAKKHPFARRLVNSGRLSVPAVLVDSPLNTPDRDPDFAHGPGAMLPGAPAADAPVMGPAGAWLLGYLGGDFTLLGFDTAVGPFGVAALARDPIHCKVVQVGGKPTAGATTIEDAQGLAVRRYGARPGTVYLLRPDQHVCARWREFDLPSVRAAIARATCAD